MEKKIGFIGCGNMAKAMIGGIVKSGLIPPTQVYASDTSESNLENAKKLYEINTFKDNKLLAKECDIIFLSVKPHIYARVIEEIKNDVKSDVIIILIAAGQSLEENQKRFGRDIKMVYAMPNTPALVGEGMTSVVLNDFITSDEKDEIKKILESFSKVEFINQDLVKAATAIAGSSPAYIYMFIEALADGGVLHGLSRNQAYTLAAQAVLGSAKMVLETDTHPGVLKDMVCSPGGSTIDAVASLEENGLRNAVIQAVNACVKKIEKM